MLRNDGHLHLTDITTPSTASKQNTFSSIVVDRDGDRNQDLVIARNTGQIEILHNLHDGRFEAVPFASGYGFWMGVAGTQPDFYPAPVAENHTFNNSPVIADFDGDSRPDPFWLNNDNPNRAYLNLSEGNRVTVVMPDTVRALGARGRVKNSDANYVREIVSATGLGTDRTPALLFGLGARTRATRLVISWADGDQTVIENPPVNRPIRIGISDTAAKTDAATAAAQSLSGIGRVNPL